MLRIIETLQKRGAEFKSLGDGWADTTTPHGRLMLAVRGGLAEFERELIKERTDAGRECAKSLGVKFSRKAKLSDTIRAKVIERRLAGESIAELAKDYGFGVATIHRAVSPPSVSAINACEKRKFALSSVCGYRRGRCKRFLSQDGVTTNDRIRTYSGVHDGVVNSILIDVYEAHKQACGLNDQEGKDALLRLWLEHFNTYLGNMSAPSLLDYLETRPIWRRHGEWNVIINPDEPCIAYTSQRNAAGEITLILLGVCYRYPNGSENEWWNNVILPRVRRLS